MLFKASEPVWANKGDESYVTDGPFLHRLLTGELLMIWSSFANKKYIEAIAYSNNGEIDGKWLHKRELLFDGGGHGMLFTSKDRELLFIMHSPNDSPNERPLLKYIFEKDGTLFIE
jgi:hypothetical protein